MTGTSKPTDAKGSGPAGANPKTPAKASVKTAAAKGASRGKRARGKGTAKRAAKTAGKRTQKLTARREVPSRSGPSRLEDARSRMYQDLIFESAECVFGEKGFDQATMQEIATEAGVSLKTVYASFAGKRELYEAIMLSRGQAMFDAVERARRGAGGPVEQLVAGTRAFVRFLFEHRDWSRIHMRSHVSWAMRPEDEGAGALWDEGQLAYEAMLREGIAAGVFCDDDPTETAQMIRAMTRVQVVSAIEHGVQDAEGVSERLVRRLLRMVCADPTEAQQEVG